MNALNKNWIFGVMASGWLGLQGCAHQAAPKVMDVQSPPSPLVAEPKSSAPVRDESATTQEDLASVLKGTILHFDYNDHLLTEESRGRLQRLAEALRKYPAAKIRVSGNCDERGTEEYNLALGHQRAEAARQYLVKLGINGSRVESISYGDEHPADERHTEEAWSQNRRDEFTSAQ